MLIRVEPTNTNEASTAEKSADERRGGWSPLSKLRGKGRDERLTKPPSWHDEYFQPSELQGPRRTPDGTSSSISSDDSVKAGTEFVAEFALCFQEAGVATPHAA